MGRPKPLLLWNGLPLVEYQAASLVEARVAEVVVVLGHRLEEVIPHIKGGGVYYAVNPDYRNGKTTSIKVGVQSLSPYVTDIVLLAVDQPRPAHVISTLIESHIRSKAPITAPKYKERVGHPLIFSSALREEVTNITEEGQGIKEVFRAHREAVNEVVFDSPIVCLDINTPQEYEDAKARYGE